jgi:hypothetical protein
MSKHATAKNSNNRFATEKKSPSPIRVQLAVCISQMVKHDYPGRWPGIAEKVAMFLQSDQHETWMGALICLHQLVKNFE